MDQIELTTPTTGSDIAGARTVAEVVEVVTSTLGIEDRADPLGPSTPLLGGLPELDSMAVVELVAALERRFGLVVDDDELTGEVFETVGSLAAFVDLKRA